MVESGVGGFRTVQCTRWLDWRVVFIVFLTNLFSHNFRGKHSQWLLAIIFRKRSELTNTFLSYAGHNSPKWRTIHCTATPIFIFQVFDSNCTNHDTSFRSPFSTCFYFPVSLAHLVLALCSFHPVILIDFSSPT